MPEPSSMPSASQRKPGSPERVQDPQAMELDDPQPTRVPSPTLEQLDAWVQVNLSIRAQSPTLDKPNGLVGVVDYEVILHNFSNMELLHDDIIKIAEIIREILIALWQSHWEARELKVESTKASIILQAESIRSGAHQAFILGMVGTSAKAAISVGSIYSLAKANQSQYQQEQYENDATRLSTQMTQKQEEMDAASEGLADARLTLNQTPANQPAAYANAKAQVDAYQQVYDQKAAAFKDIKTQYHEAKTKGAHAGNEFGRLTVEQRQQEAMAHALADEPLTHASQFASGISQAEATRQSAETEEQRAEKERYQQFAGNVDTLLAAFLTLITFLSTDHKEVERKQIAQV